MGNAKWGMRNSIPRFRFSRLLASFAIAALFLIGGFVPAYPAAAQQPDVALSGLNAVGSTIALPATDPRVIASNIINVALGVLGILFLIIIVYAGFLYLTSGGNPEKTATAVKWIRNGVIGLIIILCSWAIARYVLEKLVEAAGGGGGGGGGGQEGGGGGGFDPSGGSSVLRVVSISPNGSLSNRKVLVKVVFSLPISDAAAASPDALIVERADGTRIPGTIERNGTNRLFFAPEARCPDPNTDRFCFDADAEIRVRANDAVIAGRDAQPLRCGGFYPPCEAAFHTGTEVDVSPPSVSVITPVAGASVSADALVDIVAFASDNSAIGFVSFQVNGEEIGDDGPEGRTPASFTARTRWDTAGIPAGETRTITATAFDTDTGQTMSAPVEVRVRAAHCFNGIRDAGEIGVDCGGDQNSPEYCGACAGGMCTQDADCASGVCVNGLCVEQPIITGVEPNDGAVGSMITISGVNFGTTGEVRFLGPDGSVSVRAIPPPACVEAGVWQWGRQEVVVQVPEGAESGPLRLTNENSGLSDDTNTPAETALPDFIVNDTPRPGLCAARPSGAMPATPLRLYGTGFGNASGLVEFGSRSLAPAAWSAGLVESTYPNVPEGPYDVAVNVGGIASNAMTVNVYPVEGGGTPEIVEISPSAGPIGQYITLTGRNFGSGVGTVFFQNIASGDSVQADTSFPPACRTAFWYPTTITVKVPPSLVSGGPALPTGAYAVYVRTALPRTPESNRVGFTVNTDPIAPGICAIAPRVGPVGTDVAISGERFSTNGQVIFNGGAVGPASSWTSGQIVSRVPTGAESGPVIVRVPASGGGTISSNPVFFDVRNCNEAQGVCAADEVCCPDGVCHPPVCSDGACAPAVCSEGPAPGVFAWQFSTGVIPRAPRVIIQCTSGDLPSPTPWSGRDGGNAACVNADIGALFSTRLEPTTVNANTVRVFECTGTGGDPCVTRSSVSVSILPLIPADGAAGEGRDYLQVRPVSMLQPSTTYLVEFAAGIRGFGDGGTFMESSASCGEGNGYCFRFTTRADASPCEIVSVLVAPTSYTAHEQGEEIAYAAVPRPTDICQVIDCSTYDWNWSVSEARASVTNVRENGRGACRQTTTALMETTPGSPIQVRTAESSSGASGSGDLSITFLRPEVVASGPRCSSACLNAEIWATFNIPIDPATVAASVRLEECEREDCLVIRRAISIPPANIRVTTVPGSSDLRARYLSIIARGGTPPQNLLQPGRFYRVTLLGGTLDGIRSLSLAPMTRLNAPDGYQWTFATRSGNDVLCVPDRIVVSPSEKYAMRINDRQLFTATPYSKPDSCSPEGQQIYLDGSYAWASSRMNVAAFIYHGAIDTGTELPYGCTDRCTLAGADGVSGATARCGDGIIERGEECDGEAGCNSACLWDPVPSVANGGTCGNGRVDVREDCDPGRVCTGTLPDSSTPPGSDCTDPGAAQACATNNGTCAPVDARGCSSGCRNYGARAGGVTCGNGDIASGEDCDDGNTASGDGCSSDCLNEGSKSTLRSLCGNGLLEDGEACEFVGGVWPAGCDRVTCLHTGTKPCAVAASGEACCGNGVTEPEEDWDDGNVVSGDGVNARCLFEGSSHLYASPSFCGDGRVGAGEAAACEQPPAGPDSRIDRMQLARIIGDAVPDEASGTRMSSQLSATLEGVTGYAQYGLQCGFTSEASCVEMDTGVESYGLTGAGCCSPRPRIVNAYPPNGATNVCRNVLVSGSFNAEMDEQSLSNNFVIARRVQGTSCPDGEQLLVLNEHRQLSGLRGFFVRLWQKILAFFGAAPAQAQVWCRGGVTGTLSFSKGTRDVDGVSVPYTSFAFTLDHVFDPNTTYVVRFAGDALAEGLLDNADVAQRLGIKTKVGVVSPTNFEWTFTTGQEICRLNAVRISDETASQPFLFTSANEAHPFVAVAQSVRNGAAVPISATDAYGWEWESWTVSSANIATLSPEALPQPPSVLSADTRTVISTTVSGSAYVSARAHISRDTMETPSTIGAIVAGAEEITTMICENPWPSRQAAPFADEAGSLALAETIFANGPFYHFSMTYCRDAGAPGPNEDLPTLEINPVPQTPAQKAEGVLREYLFTFGSEAEARDAIGVRVMENPRHLGIRDWYESRGFSGTPTSLTVDGYEALREGRTVYVAAVSTEGVGYPMYSNIYVFSYSDGASAVTRQIFDALIQSLAFNVNFTSGVSAACVTAAGSVVTDAERLPIACMADWQCDAYGANLHCDNFKAKVQRDLLRIAAFQGLSRSLETAKVRDGKYPALTSGSYLSGFTTSLWPSWNDALQKALSPQGGISLPSDPVNRFVTCGRCAESAVACTRDADCPRQGEACTAIEGYDPRTCWNEQSRAYRCATEVDAPSSHLLTYRAQDQGERYELAAEFEVPPPNPNDPSVGWWSPPLYTEVKQCVTQGELGRACVSDADCRTCPLGNCTNIPVIAGSCRAAGGTYRYVNICDGGSYGESSVCGDGIIDANPAHNRCLGGSRDGQACAVAGDCPGGACAPREICETTGQTASRTEVCSADGFAGTQRQVCEDCLRYVNDPAYPMCEVARVCGNGRIDQICGDIACVTLEVCDDGKLNGTYGHCNTQCSGFTGYCGDGMVSLGETCDLGFGGTPSNGSYCSEQACSIANSCNLSCSGMGPVCGDGNVDAPQEQCDGGSLSTEKAICTDNITPCSSDADCPGGATCTYLEACPVSRVCSGPGPSAGNRCQGDSYCSGDSRCSTQAVQTYRTLQCGDNCAYDLKWSSCKGMGYCGDGIKDTGEECDDGNAVDTDACTSFCKKNVCGDGFRYDGVEECDLGNDPETGNGTPCDTAEYGSTCSSCSRSCKFQLTQGGFCGNGVIDTGSAEQCDTGGDTAAFAFADDLAHARSCRALGYDYALATIQTSQGVLDRVTCSLSCGYSGCAMCGSPQDRSTEDPLFNGVIEGQLFDTLFQQPVEAARVTLFYRGLQVAVTASDADGFFSFVGLDRHDGCNQYKLVIDSYGDNPRTTIFNEALRGGYMAIETPSFQPHRNPATETNTDGLFTHEMIAWGNEGKRTTEDRQLRGYAIPRFNMLPRLKENEYIVQLWWEPSGGVDEILDEFSSLPSDAARDAYYADFQGQLHDLVIREPFTYAPGTFASCSIGGVRPLTYDPTSSVRQQNGRGLQADILGEHNKNIDVTDPVMGMLSCTNKIRATFSKTCRLTDLETDEIRNTNIGCATRRMCLNRPDIDYGQYAVTCDGSPEPNRQGSPDVLNGQEGAYLFCFHPEWLGINDDRASQVDCGNFILPPQSAFIRAQSGQYDVLVSKYYLASGAELLHHPQGGLNSKSIRAWLMAHEASVIIYDQYGVRETISPERDDDGSWAELDDAPRVCLDEGDRDGFGDGYWTVLMSRNYELLGEFTYSPVWTPASISPSAGSVNGVRVWGDAGADFHFFSDLAYRWTDDGLLSLSAACWERTCSELDVIPNVCALGTDITNQECSRNSDCTAGYQCYMQFPNKGTSVCNGAGTGYLFGGNAITMPACDEASKVACLPGSRCATGAVAAHPDTDNCVQICEDDSDCTRPNSFCGGIRECSGSGQSGSGTR